jgi:SSS family solute:Na+ symporter
MNASLSFLDYAVVAVYLAGTVLLGLWIGRGIRNSRDYFLGGRQLPWWAIGMSLVATDIGGTDIIGVAGAAYRHGLAVGNFEWIGCVPAMVLAAYVFIPYFYRSGVSTVPEFVERRYNAGVRGALAACSLTFMACNLGIMLLASSKMMTVLFGWPLSVGLLGTAGLVGVYTISGGLAAVVYTDVLQCVLMIGGCLLVTGLGLWELGGLEALRDRMPTDEHLSLILPVDTATPFPWPAILFGLAFVLSPAYWIGNQAIVQRSLGARSESDARAAYLWGAVLKNVIPVIIAVPGLIAVARFPELADGDRAYPLLVTAVLPVGLRGLFISAFVAALMSSIDSYLNSAATIVTHDLYARFVNQSADDVRLLRVGRWTTFVLVMWAVGFAYWLTYVTGTGLYTIFQTMMAFFQGPALAILLCGMLWRRATGVAALLAFLTGVAVAVGLFVLSQPAVTAGLGWRPLFQISEPFLYFSVWAFLMTLGLTIVLSLVTSPEPEEKQRYTLGGLRLRTTEAAA